MEQVDLVESKHQSMAIMQHLSTVRSIILEWTVMRCALKS